MTLRAQYRSGLQLGARPKAAPEYIGATARASRRRARLAELDRLIADLGRQREDLAAQRQRAADLLADLGRAQQELPKTAPVTEALGQVTSAEGQRTGARTRLAGTQETLDGATAELDTRARRLRHAAADRGLPASADELDTVERAVADFARAAEDLVRTRGELAAIEQDLHQRLDRVSHLTSDNAEAAELLAENQALYVAGAEKLSVDERASGAEYEQIRDEILERNTACRPPGPTGRRPASRSPARTTRSWGRSGTCRTAAVPWRRPWASWSRRRPRSSPTRRQICGRCWR